jgi:hypothetical protein
MSENNVASRALIRAALAGKVDPEYAAVLADKHAGRVQFTDTDIDEPISARPPMNTNTEPNVPTFDATKSLQNAVRDFRQKLIDHGMTAAGADEYTERHRGAFVVTGDGDVRVDGVSAHVQDPIAHLARVTFANAGAAVKQQRDPSEEEIAQVRAIGRYGF